MKSFYLQLRSVALVAVTIWLSSFVAMGQEYCAKVDYSYEIHGQEVKFIGSSPETVQEWYWYFGDNSAVVRGQSQKYAFEKPGSYEVCLKILVNDHCTGAVCKKVQVGNTTATGCDLKPDFHFAVSGHQVKFQGTSNAGDNAKYYWSFGNGKSAEGRDVLAEFTHDGTYEVCLKVHAPSLSTTTGPCTEGICKKIQIGTGSNAGCDLKADFSHKSDGLTGLFYASSVDDHATYYWNITGHNEQYSGKEVKITFTKPGYYEVCMTAVNGAVTCKEQVCKKIEIGTNCDLKADFTFDSSGNTFTFKATSDAGSHAKYYWSFGNGSSAEGQQVSTVFTGHGHYEVCLKVVGGPATTATNACVDVVCKKIKTGPDNQECPLEADFKYSANGKDVTFRASSNDDKAVYYWFGSGITSSANLTGNEVVVKFEKDGVYEMCLVAVDGAQTCKVKVCKKVTVGDNIKVYPNPATDFIYLAAHSRIIRASVSDQMNKELIASEINGFDGRIDVSGLPSGLYVAKLLMEDQSVFSSTFYKQ